MDGSGTISVLSFQLSAATPGEGLGSCWLPLPHLPLSPVYSRKTAGILSLNIKQGQAAPPAQVLHFELEINNFHFIPGSFPCLVASKPSAHFFFLHCIYNIEIISNLHLQYL